MTRAYQDIFYDSPDGLRLYARDYNDGGDKPVILCMHGLTRSSRDFHELAMHLRGRYRIIAVDQRGRGRSAYDPDSANYRAEMYCGDMLALIEKLNLSAIIVIGTSMGGIMTMIMASMKPGMFKAVIMNDIGAEIDPKGLQRIGNYVGQSGVFENWAAAANALKAQGPEIFPGYTEVDWADFARRTCVETGDGRVRFNYDPAIAKALKNDDEAAAPIDMWPLYMALLDTPFLLIRGAMSDILSRDTAEKMMAAHSGASLAEIPRIGHAPMLTEPESLAAIDRFLESLS